jgi:hypothetical protein
MESWYFVLLLFVFIMLYTCMVCMYVPYDELHLNIFVYYHDHIYVHNIVSIPDISSDCLVTCIITVNINPINNNYDGD